MKVTGGFSLNQGVNGLGSGFYDDLANYGGDPSYQGTQLSTMPASSGFSLASVPKEAWIAIGGTFLALTLFGHRR